MLNKNLIPSMTKEIHCANMIFILKFASLVQSDLYSMELISCQNLTNKQNKFPALQIQNTIYKLMHFLYTKHTNQTNTQGISKIHHASDTKTAVLQVE